MRKLYLFFAVLCALFGSQTANAANFEAGKTYYLNLNGFWVDANNPARFVAYFYESDINNEWCNLEKVYESQIYKVTPSKSWNNVIFVRKSSSNNTNDWNGVWNQTSDITSRSGNMYNITDWDKSGMWSDTDFCYYLVGTFNSWSESDSYKLTDNEYGVFSLDKVSFTSATTGELKVKSSVGTWYGLSSSFTFSETSTSTAGLSANIKAGENNIPYNLPSEYSVSFTLGSSSDTLTFTKTSDDSGDDSGDDSSDTTYADIWLVDGNGNELKQFTKDSTYPYIWTLSSYTAFESVEATLSTRFRFRIYTTEDKSIYIDYSIDSSNYSYLNNYSNTNYYGLKETTSSFGLPSGTYYFAVTTYGGALYNAKISTSTIDLTVLPDPTPETETEIDIPENLNMPLKERDFAEGKARYFVVGTRMSEWRLQPEWELLDEDGDGTYTLNNRLLYNGKMGIAKVESYDDYIHQRYTFYSVNSTISGDQTLTLTTKTNPKADVLTVTCEESTNKFTAINYGKDYTKDQFTSSNTIIWGGLGEDPIRTCTPTYVGTISVVDNDTSGLTLTLSGSSTDASVIAQYRTFSLVGSAIYNTDFNTEETCATPLRNDGSGPITWQEAWIQYDNYGKPYYDAYGNTLYQTVFQREWLKNHPTIFKANDGFEYNSINIVFNYDDSTTHTATIPTDGEEGWATNNGSTSSPNKSYSVTNNDGWQCFVVENMWLSGQFKVWTGWGGADKTQDGSNSNSGEARWYYANGGHHTESADWKISASKTIYYGTAQDKNEADFSLGDDRIFARYVKVWWNPSEGFDGSFLQLITEQGGPQISCERNDKHSLKYTWSVPEEQLAKNYDVKNIKIVRYRLDSDGNETSIVITNTPYAESELSGSNVNEKAVTGEVDDNPAEGGYYWYKIEIEYYGNESAEEQTDFTRDAESNRVYIYYETIPNGATVKQLAYTTAAAETRAAESTDVTEKFWSFDLAVNASAPESLIGKKLESDASKDVLSLVQYYVVGVPKQTAGDTYTSASVNGETVTALTTEQLNDIEKSVSALNMNTDNYTYFGLKPDADKYYAMPELILHNVIPDSYYAASSKNFTIDMVSEDGDNETWATTNVSTAKPEVSMYVPTTCYNVTTFAITKADDTEEMATDSDNQPLGTSETQSVSFHSFNKLQTTDGKIAQLMVTNSVLIAWKVKYSLSATVGETTFSATPQYENSSVNAADGVTANFDYLPVAYTSDNKGEFGTSITAIDDLTFRKIDAETFKVTTGVEYTRNVGSVKRTASSADFTKSITPTAEGNVTNYDKLVTYEKATLATNGFTVHNKGAWSSTTSDGEVIYFLDAYKAIALNNEDTTLNKAVGYYSSNGHSCTTKYYGETATAGYQEIAVVAGGEVITEGTGYTDPFNVLINDGYGDDDNFAEKAASVGILPIKIGHIGEGNAAGTNLTYSDVYTVLTAEYPFLVKPGLVSTVATSDESTETPILVTLAYPSLVKATSEDATTEIDDVTIAAGDFRIYPNPAVDVVNVASSAALGRVEIYSVDGRLVKVVEVDDTHAAIEVSDLVKGSYIIRAAGATQRMIKK